MFLSDGQIKQSLADTLKVDLAELEPYWDRLVTECHLSGYQTMRGHLLSRGFTALQVDNWARGAEFERDLSLYWLLKRGSTLHNYDKDTVEAFNRFKELELMAVETDAGLPQAPGGDPGMIASGNFSTEDDDWTKDTVI